MVRQFDGLKGQDLVQLLNTLAGEGTLKTPGVIHKLQATHPLGAQNTLYISEDVFIHASSTEFKFSLSSALGKRGLIDKAQLQEMKDFRKAQQPTPSLAGLLLKHELVSPSNLLRVINHLNEVLAYEIMMWPNADFKLFPLEERPDDFSTFFAGELKPEGLLNVQDFALDADKNMPVLLLMREKLANPNMILRRTREVADNELSEHQALVHMLVNNRNSLRDILLLSDLDYFETYTALFQLLSWEMVGVGSLETPRYLKKEPAPTVRPSVSPRPAPSLARAAAPPAAKAEPESTGEERLFLRRARGADLFQVLSSLLKGGKRSGKLVVESQKSSVRSELMLHEGNLVHASSTMYSHRFGDLLVKKGTISSEQLNAALETQKESAGKHLGEILVEQKLIPADTIPKIIYHQIECVLYELLSWPDAKYYFEESARPLQQQFVVFADYEIVDGRLIHREGSDEPSGRDVLGDADKNLAILLMIKEKMPQPKALVSRTAKDPDSALSSEQEQVMTLVNGQNSINDILVLSDLDYFATYTALFQVFSTGLIEIQELRDDTAGAQESVVARKPIASTRPESISEVVKPKPASPSPVSAPPAAPPSRPAVTASANASQPYEQLRKILGEDILRALTQFPAHQTPALRKALEALIEIAHSSR